MSDLPTLTEQTIRNWTDAGSFQRGTGYYHQDRILNPRRQERTLKAQCLGSMPQPYRVEVTLGESGPVVGHCSCPIGAGGHCKHAVALLLTWLHEPESFTQVAALEDTLRDLGKDQLIDLIHRMLDREPDLESLVELQILSQPNVSKQINAARIQQQTSQAMRSGRGDWQDGYYIAQQLIDIVTLGDSYAEHEDWRNAATVYATIAKTILEDYGYVYDDEGDVLGPVYDCVRGLGLCLTEITGDKIRGDILQTLFHIYRWDMNFGGVGISDEVPGIILEETCEKEQEALSSWIYKALPNAREWSRQQYGYFLLDLKGDQLDDEAYLQICRETALTLPLVERLLTLHRVDEAVETAQQSSDYVLLQIADIFVKHQLDQSAYNLISQRAQTSDDRRLKPWLKAYADSHDDPETALTLAHDIFWQQSRLTTYQELEQCARTLDRWETLRADILRKLEDTKPSLLVEIHLYEDNINAALKTLADMTNKERGRGYGWYSYPRLQITVAEAAEDRRPYAAIDLYMDHVVSLIAQRGRGNYAQAAQYLLRVRELYRQLEGEAEWAILIKNLREENRRLPAMQDEFNKAGLGGKP